MKRIFVFVLLFRFVIGDDCGSHYYDGHWICSRNANSKLNVTYDCKLNNGKYFVVWIWSPAFADEMDVFTIRNCETVSLYTKFPPKIELDNSNRIDPKNNFHSLHVVNVSLLSITNTLTSNWNTNYRKIYYYRYGNFDWYNRKCSLKNIIFENVQNAKFENFFHDCFEKNGEFKSLKLINFNVEKLNIKNLKLEELIVKKVTIHEAEPDTFRLSGPGTFFKITDSNFTKISNNFVTGNANEVVISNNSFNKFHGKIFTLQAEKVIFSNNKINTLPDDSLSFTSGNIQIVNNTFHHIDENGFRSISGMKSASKSYNFSNNIIYSLAEGTLNNAPQNEGQKIFLNNLLVTNNEINCDCDNMYWFDSIAKKNNDVEQSRFFYKWVKNKYQNKCLNIPNCFMDQVLQNYQELCSEDYNCSAEQYDLLKPSHILESYVNYNIKMNQNISDLFENVIDRVENKSLRNFKKDKRVKNYFISFVENFREKQKQISSLPYDNIMEVCFVLITILFCFGLIYFAVAKFLKLPFLNALTSKFGAKGNNVIIETDGNSSSVSELMSSI